MKPQLEAQPAAHAVADVAAGANCSRGHGDAARRAPRSTRVESAIASASSRLRWRRRRPATSRGTYSRPARQSRPKSCQKFVSCSAVHSASDDRSSARPDSRRCAAPAGRPDSPIGGSSRARRPTKRSGSSWYPAERAQQIVEQRDRQIERIESNERARRRSGPRARAARSADCSTATAACSRRCQASSCASRSAGRRRAFVRDVVGDARERVDGRDVRTHRAAAAGATPRENSRSATAPAPRMPRRRARAARGGRGTGGILVRLQPLVPMRDVVAASSRSCCCSSSRRAWRRRCRRYRRRRLRARDSERALGRTVIAEIPAGDDLVAVQRGRGRASTTASARSTRI